MRNLKYKRITSPLVFNRHVSCPIRNHKYKNDPRGNFLNGKDWRTSLLFFAMLVVFGLIIFRLIFLQIFSHEALAQKAKNQHLFFQKIKAKRGQIYLKDGEDNIIPVATNEEKNMVIIVPKYIEDTEGTIKTLATILNIDEQEVRDKVMKREDLYEVIKRRISGEEEEMIKEKEMKGVQLIGEDLRNYPEGQLASQILGFVGYKDDKRMGQYGIEGKFNDILEGEVGFVKAEKDTAGRWISISKRIFEKPKNGNDLILTIHQSAQYFVEKLLEESVQKYGASGGSIIVMDPHTGKIIAMANYPTFNSNEFNKVEDAAAFKNKCISSQYEPGSVFKPFTASIPLDLGKLEPDSTYVDKGSFPIAGYTIRNSDGKAYGEITLTRFLELSLNTGAIWAMQSAGKEDYLRYLKNYGFGKTTGIDLAGEADGDIRNLDYLRDINFVTAAFGQGISVTPLQLANSFCAVVNGGSLMRPEIIDSFIDDGKKEFVEPEVVRQVITPNTSRKIRAMLVSVVKNGWGKKAGVPGYLIGGKTGTAQMPNTDGPGYSDKTIHSFIGFGPADDPKFVTLVKLDEVSAVNFAADSVTLVTGRLNKFLLDYYHAFPTEEITEEELKYFNRLMELKEEDIQKAKEESKEGAEGFVPLGGGSNNTNKESDSDKDIKDKKKDKDD